MHWGICPYVSAFYAGALAQLGERLICIQEVRSSILLGSTSLEFARLRMLRKFQEFGSVAQVVRAHA